MNTLTRESLFGDLKSGEPQISLQSANHAGVGPHNHEAYEMVYVRSGFCLHETNDRMTLLTEGDFFLIRPGQVHRYLGSQAVQLYNCLFGESCVPARLREHSFFRVNAPLRVHLDLGERKTISRLMSRIASEMTERTSQWETAAESLLAQLLCEYVRTMEKRRPGGDMAGYAGYVTPALSYIDRNYRSEISMADLAREAGVTADYLTRQFKQLAGITPLTYLRRFRIARSMELIGGGCSASEAAERVGFHSLSHYSREFKRELGLTPTQYRQQEHI